MPRPILPGILFPNFIGTLLSIGVIKSTADLLNKLSPKELRIDPTHSNARILRHLDRFGVTKDIEPKLKRLMKRNASNFSFEKYRLEGGYKPEGYWTQFEILRWRALQIGSDQNTAASLQERSTQWANILAQLFNKEKELLGEMRAKPCMDRLSQAWQSELMLSAQAAERLASIDLNNNLVEVLKNFGRRHPEIEAELYIRKWFPIAVLIEQFMNLFMNSEPVPWIEQALPQLDEKGALIGSKKRLINLVVEHTGYSSRNSFEESLERPWVSRESIHQCLKRWSKIGGKIPLESPAPAWKKIYEHTYKDELIAANIIDYLLSKVLVLNLNIELVHTIFHEYYNFKKEFLEKHSMRTNQ
ncbi:hypothetical protein EUZ85_02275 [Hahella sp. KA22]|uniref:hypothetical protein n=1 Tax=Hahella sp. KA22 TaxID=1628392 RepID=UPI000FDE9E74|nr:hypothetical protein [Hahella sp. KA22]AZZ95320.1 hypothetical protein ENC22_30565 [Hahella sp. KA22]QAY52965.1 hypothetical protein EUZ85_02275 [Hahella sp. KA22]